MWKRTIKISVYIAIIVLFLTLIRYNSNIYLSSDSFKIDGSAATRGDYLFLNDHFYILNPVILLSSGGIIFSLTFLSLIILFIFKFKESLDYSILVMFSGIIIVPLFLIYNPLIVPFLVKIMTWILPRRINYNPNFLIFFTILFSSISFFIAKFLKKIKLFQNKKIILDVIPLFFIIFLIVLLLGIKDLREGVLTAINAKEGYLNIVEIPKNNLFNYLNTKIPKESIICSDPSTSYLVGAYTSHYVASFHLTRMGVSYEEAAKRAYDNDRIMGLSLFLEDLIKISDRYRCNYIVFNKKDHLPDETKEYQPIFENIFESENYFIMAKKNN